MLSESLKTHSLILDKSIDTNNLNENNDNRLANNNKDYK